MCDDFHPTKTGDDLLTKQDSRQANACPRSRARCTTQRKKESLAINKATSRRRRKNSARQGVGDGGSFSTVAAGNGS